MWFSYLLSFSGDVLLWHHRFWQSCEFETWIGPCRSIFKAINNGWHVKTQGFKNAFQCFETGDSFNKNHIIDTCVLILQFLSPLLFFLEVACVLPRFYLSEIFFFFSFFFNPKWTLFCPPRPHSPLSHLSSPGKISSSSIL